MLAPTFQLAAYAATIKRYEELFLREVTAQGLASQIDSLSTDAKRAWISAVVLGGTARGVRAMLKEISTAGETLNAIVDPGFTQPYFEKKRPPKEQARLNPLKGGIVRAAEARLLDKYINLNAP
jgi:outer membrane murein-binding lipoprotein Lpp